MFLPAVGGQAHLSTNQYMTIHDIASGESTQSPIPDCSNRHEHGLPTSRLGLSEGHQFQSVSSA